MTDRRSNTANGSPRSTSAVSANIAGKVFADSSDDDKDERAQGPRRAATLKLDGTDGKAFFEQAVKDTQMGFFADPIYGGNRDMAAGR